MRRLRNTGAVDQDGNIVTISRLPSVTGSNKPPGWNRWSDAEKVEHLLGMSLDRMHDYLSWPADGLDVRGKPPGRGARCEKLWAGSRKLRLILSLLQVSPS
jgi:hypothetical protein